MSIKTDAMNSFGLSKLKLNVPVDPRMCLETPNVAPVITLFNEMYICLGLEKCRSVLDKALTPVFGIMEAQIHIEDSPFGDSKQQVRPISDRNVRSTTSVITIRYISRKL